MSCATAIAVPRRGGHGQQDDRRGDVVGVCGAAAVQAGRHPAAEPRPERPAEDVDEQEQEDQRHQGDHHGQRRIALHVPQVAAQHDPRVDEGVGTGAASVEAAVAAGVVHRHGAHRQAPFLPVRAKKTSSRSGCAR
jgi:hypothetical protein